MEKMFVGQINYCSRVVLISTLVLLITSAFQSEVFGQGDSTYYVSYKKKLTSRVYTSRKYTSLIVSDRVNNQSFRFEPNSTLNLGVGATYNDFTLNLAFGFGFMNPDRGTGETKFLDLQAHMYPKNWVIDLFGQFYNGYYLQQINGENLSSGEIIVYPDLQVRMLGANVQYLFNGDQLSLKAAFLQSAWQKKSAGSIVAGFEFYGGWATNDGGIIPGQYLGLDQRNFQNLGFFQFGPNIGYVHTFVFLDHFFITGMASANLGVGQSYLDFDEGRTPKWGVTPNVFLRGFVGYNGPKWSVNANYVHNRVRMHRVGDYSNDLLTGNYRINFIYRFDVGPKLKPYLDYIDINRYIPLKKDQKNTD